MSQMRNSGYTMTAKIALPKTISETLKTKQRKLSKLKYKKRKRDFCFQPGAWNLSLHCETLRHRTKHIKQLLSHVDKRQHQTGPWRQTKGAKPGLPPARP